MKENFLNIHNNEENNKDFLSTVTLDYLTKNNYF